MKIEALQEILIQQSLVHGVVFVGGMAVFLYFKGQTTIKLARIFLEGLKDTLPFIIKFLSFLITVCAAFIIGVFTSKLVVFGVFALVMGYIIYSVVEESNARENSDANIPQQVE